MIRNECQLNSDLVWSFFDIIVCGKHFTLICFKVVLFS